MVVEVVGRGLHDGGADAQYGGLAGGANPEVAMLHEEVDAVFLQRDGVGGGLVDALEDFERFDVELEAGGGAVVAADLAGDFEGGFEGEVFEGFEELFGDGGLGHDALDGAGAVAEDRKEELTGGAEIVEPGLQGDGLAFVRGERGDGGYGRCGGFGGFHGLSQFTPAGKTKAERRGRGGKARGGRRGEPCDLSAASAYSAFCFCFSTRTSQKGGRRGRRLRGRCG